jgi:alpha-1,3-rhamnosyltransferase
MSQHPLISVCIASYNHARFLRETLDSVLQQTYPNFEVVVVDDGSSDESLQILADYARKDLRVKALTHPENQNRGISFTTNTAIDNSGGEYIAFIGSDDVWYPEALGALYKNIRIDRSVSFVYGMVKEIDATGNVIGQRGENILTAQDPLAELLKLNRIPAMAVLVRRAMLYEVGLLDPNVLYGDWELWIRLMSRFKVGFVNEFIGNYRIHGRNVSTGIDPEKDFREALVVLASIRTKRREIGGRLADKMIDAGVTAARTRLSIALLDKYFGAARAGNLVECARHLRNSLLASPRVFLNLRRLFAVLKFALTGIIAALRALPKNIKA